MSGPLNIPSLSGAPPSIPIDLAPALAWPGLTLVAFLACATAVIVVSSIRETGRRLPELIGAAAAGSAFEPLVGVLLDAPAFLSDLWWRMVDLLLAMRAAMVRAGE
jgi:hypothetical protein